MRQLIDMDMIWERYILKATQNQCEIGKWFQVKNYRFRIFSQIQIVECKWLWLCIVILSKRSSDPVEGDIISSRN